MDASEQVRRQEIVRRRLVAMGLAPEPISEGRALVATLRLCSQPFPTLEGGSFRVEAVRFASVGDDRMKCLAPRVFFYLPFVRIVDCRSADELEQRLRDAWGEQLERVRATRRWLEKLGAHAIPLDDAPGAALPLTFGHVRTRAVALGPRHLMLPTCGPLAGIALRRAEDRLFVADPALGTGVDLELAITSRMEQLARLDARLEREARLAVANEATNPPQPADREPPVRLLLVGRELAGDVTLLESLRLRNWHVVVARDAAQAMRAFDVASPELVLSETALNRFEGIELVHALRSLPGIEEIPVVLVDDRARPERREAAKRAGAAGYLVRPIEIPRIAQGLGDLARRPRRRRFTRYPSRLAVRPATNGQSLVTEDVARGGMFVWSERDLPIGHVDRYQITLPTPGGVIEVEAQALYRRTVPGSARSGAGLRFFAFAGDGESRWIAWLKAGDDAGAERDPY